MVFSNFMPIFPGCEGTARRENYANTACLQFQQLLEIAVSIIMLIWKHLLVLRKPIAVITVEPADKISFVCNCM